MFEAFVDVQGNEFIYEKKVCRHASPISTYLQQEVSTSNFIKLGNGG